MVTSNYFSRFSLPYFRRNPVPLLALCWCFGMLSGCLIAAGGGDSFHSWMRAVDFSGVSIVCLFTVLILPFLFSAFAVSVKQFWIIFILAFFRAFSFGFCALGVAQCYGSAGWLVCWLLLFSDFMTLPWLCGFFCYCLSCGKQSVITPSVCAAALIFMVVSLDRCVISPFLASLL